MVRDDAHRAVVVRRRAVPFAGHLPDRADDRLEQIGIIVTRLALDHRCETLQTHAGVDAGLGQRVERALFVPVVLHEDQVPELYDPVTLAVRERVTGHAGSLVVMDFGAGPAGAGVRHLPEVVLLPAFDDARGWDLDLRCPDGVGLVVLLVDRHPQPLRRKLDDAGQIFPCQIDCLFLEVVAKGEVAEHLEEGVVPAGVPDVLEIVVLAAGPDAFLRGGGPGVGAVLLSEEDALELDHAGVGEEQRGIGLRNQRGTRDNGVALPFEVVQEALS